jgi:RimJ/RimL family protein N-acetyltransferase
MAGPPIELRPFGAADLAVVSPWFLDADTRRFLGGPQWPRQMLVVGESAVGTTFRGARQTGVHRWVGYRDGVPVGYVDCGTFDRWTTCDERLHVIDAIERPAGAIAFVTAPEHRRRGIARAMIRAALAEPAIGHVEIVGAGADPDNAASLAVLRALGFVPQNTRPDWEGMLYLLLDRDRANRLC